MLPLNLTTFGVVVPIKNAVVDESQYSSAIFDLSIRVIGSLRVDTLSRITYTLRATYRDAGTRTAIAPIESTSLCKAMKSGGFRAPTRSL